MKSRSHKRFLTFILIFALLIQIAVMSSCNRRYDEDEVIAAIKVLLKDAEKLNLIYYGEGIRYYDEENAKGYYRKAEKTHLDELGFSTVDELKEITEKTFSKEYSEIIYSTVLSPIMSDIGMERAVRYYQAYDEKSGQPTYIMVHSKFESLMKDAVSYDYDSITVEGAKKEKVFASVNATVTNSEGKIQNVKITITLIEQEDGWRIDNPVYANYSDSRE